MERATYTIELKSLDEEGTFTGYLSTYAVDQGGDKVLPGAFKKTLREWQAKKKPIPLFLNHDDGKPVGFIRAAQEDEKGLAVEGKVLQTLSLGKDAYEMLKAGILGAMSMGYSAIKWSIENEVRLLKEVKLFEASLVFWPMNEQCAVTAVKGEDGDYTAQPTPSGAGTIPPEPVTGHSEARTKALLREIRRAKLHIASKLL